MTARGSTSGAAPRRLPARNLPTGPRATRVARSRKRLRVTTRVLDAVVAVVRIQPAPQTSADGELAACDGRHPLPEGWSPAGALAARVTSGRRAAPEGEVRRPPQKAQHHGVEGRATGRRRLPLTDDLLARPSPLHFDHIDFLGRYACFRPVEAGRRPLPEPSARAVEVVR